MSDLEELKIDVVALAKELIERAQASADSVFVLGLSTSEVVGGFIGRNSSLEVGQALVSALYHFLKEQGIFLAVQGCEHINRALVVERSLAQARGWEIVQVIPTPHAGGSGQVAAMQVLEDPVVVEFVTADLGVDIGDTAIGMHVKHVQVPVRLAKRELGGAHVTALASRPKLIGGARAEYALDPIRKF
ncbi:MULTISPECIES: TIGR01440 family protein [unclassified Streptococcus]|uniref:TIGR01440 family protein n=1 Tax=unclassified Streptococcus TaxID=2608887 RepID=UPI001072A5E7|nr:MULTISPECIES: TIGR01440 family protein [unclassified Streptococcus]MBF0805951.1 TIGR01440 family protein [Streptococcus sp. 19428wA2_WM07]TFU28475.1 TIGR01440 family protein [Streptococcus sp. WM07]